MRSHDHLAALRALQQNALNMARLTPFPADRDRFQRIAERYREEAARLDQAVRPPRT
ncbi:hypothetical protein HNP32_000920 [Brevundimonas bullata]|uniref:Uncharacterized protein n=1 Tax=Brevundimonas bullata TaxID=13160 RepID=A0A7W7IMP6_9CAUL|nr:hypothetical protein [Brevundimonas bullata]MBB6382155.1 hypothetical protein [Brevundimonas bullata]